MKTHIHTHTQHSVQEEWNRAAQHLPQLLTKKIVKLMPLLAASGRQLSDETGVNIYSILFIHQKYLFYF